MSARGLASEQAGRRPRPLVVAVRETEDIAGLPPHFAPLGGLGGRQSGVGLSGSCSAVVVTPGGVSESLLVAHSRAL